MEENVLVDSSFFINRLRKRLDPFQELAEADDRFEFFSCGVVRTEVCRGLKYPRWVDQAKENFAVMCWVPTTDKIWDRALDIAWNLGRDGITMQVTDLIIAASALSVDAVVLTLDSDFSFVPGLRVIHRLA